MANVAIWTKSAPAARPPAPQTTLRPVLVFRGVLSAVPRIGEFIDPFSFASGHPVLEVWHKLDDDEVEVYIGPDFTGELLEAARRRGIEQPFHS